MLIYTYASFYKCISYSCTPDIEDDHASPRSSSTPCRAIVLFWSGGKDSLLAYYTLKRKIESESRDDESTTTATTMIVLLSTFDGRNEFVANQEVPFDLIRRQVSARHHLFIERKTHISWLSRLIIFLSSQALASIHSFIHSFDLVGGPACVDWADHIKFLSPLKIEMRSKPISQRSGRPTATKYISHTP